MRCSIPTHKDTCDHIRRTFGSLCLDTVAIHVNFSRDVVSRIYSSICKLEPGIVNLSILKYSVMIHRATCTTSAFSIAYGHGLTRCEWIRNGWLVLIDPAGRRPLTEQDEVLFRVIGESIYIRSLRSKPGIECWTHSIHAMQSTNIRDKGDRAILPTVV